MSKEKRSPSASRGEIWIASLDPIQGHEQGRVRPVLVLSEDRFNRSPADLVIVAPITTTDRRLVLHIRVDPPEGGLTRPSFIMTDQVRAVSKLRIGRRLGITSTATLAEVEDRLRYLLRL